MDALTLLREQTARAHQTMTDVFAVVTPEYATWRLEGSLANTIVGTFLHSYHGEDSTVQERLRGRSTLFESGGWSKQLPYDPAKDSWSVNAVPDLAAVRAYAAAVAAATGEYLGSLAPSELDREVDTPRGKVTIGVRLGLILVTHKFLHMGEIGALLGCQGAKGFPR